MARVLFGLLTPSLGGHTRTAVAVADVLRDRGYAIDFLVRESTDAEPAGSSSVTASLVRAAGFPVIPIAGLYGRPGARSFRQNLSDLVRRSSYDVLHWFEEHGLRDAAVVAAAERRAFVWTFTSGGRPVGYHGLNSVVVFTPEVAEDARRRSPRTVAHVVPARFDFRSLDSRFVRSARHDIRHRFSVGDADLLIVRVARCTSVYLRSIRLGIALAARLSRGGRPAVFLHAGYVEDRRVALEIQQTIDRANAAAGRSIAYSVAEGVEIGTRYAAAADVCIASGRSAIEALALERPTLVAWGSRYLGMVDAENIQTIAATNFQGRNSELVSDDEVVGQMHDAVYLRLAEPARGAGTQTLCAHFIKQHYSVESAADTYERLYADRTVTIDGLLKHYGNPQHLGRELFHRLPVSLRFSRPLSFLRRRRLWPGLPRNE